ncbi:GNAT family N-acetyltransferase [Cellulomonas gilvus]|uniref:GNAT family N-acetyltransferase n=1 Tax=Cellulomonas gilvus TaxID=11 RepID=UPI0002E89DD7|nr:GNAT family N-acetyltransferase [Cellulomonas gilvus]
MLVRPLEVIVPLLYPPALDPDALAGSPLPDLTADGLVLRTWRDDDAPAVRAAYADPATQRWHARRLDSDDEALDLVRAWRDAWAAGTGASWAVDDPELGMVGRVAVKIGSAGDGTGVLAYWTAPEARGRGVSARAVRAVARWAFATGFHRLEVEHSTGNPASCRVAEKAGFPAEGTRRGSARHADGWHDMHVHALLAPDSIAVAPAPDADVSDAPAACDDSDGPVALDASEASATPDVLADHAPGPDVLDSGEPAGWDGSGLLAVPSAEALAARPRLRRRG